MPKIKTCNEVATCYVGITPLLDEAILNISLSFRLSFDPQSPRTSELIEEAFHVRDLALEILAEDIYFEASSAQGRFLSREDILPLQSPIVLGIVGNSTIIASNFERCLAS